MSLITSCPACGTMFRVVPDQLKISEGWVRCGHCSEVFDAAAHMVDEAILEDLRGADAVGRAATPDVPPYLAAQPAAADAAPGEPPPDEPLQDELPAVQEGPGLPAGETAAAPAPVDAGASSGFFEADNQSLEPSPLDSPFVFRRSDLVDGIDSSLPPAPEASHWPDAHDEAAEEELHDLSFVRQARRRAFWRRPLVRVLLGLSVLVLSALLVLQLAWQDRDRLALQQPELRPALERMCELLRCRLGPPRQIESLVIESSGFTRVRQDTFRLAFALRNTARVQVAVPAMELSVTDGQDQVIARRVLMPAELGAPGEAIAPASEWSGAVGIVFNAPGAARVAGYRLLAFYP